MLRQTEIETERERAGNLDNGGCVWVESDPAEGKKPELDYSRACTGRVCGRREGEIYTYIILTVPEGKGREGDIYIYMEERRDGRE